MKIKYILMAFAALAIASCASKIVAMEPSDHAVPQMPKVSETLPISEERIVEGRATYQNNCAKCHKLYSPTEFSRLEWEPILVRMQPKAKLDDAQISLVRDYIHSETN
jgi:mono/diheme cytochrome c family protein